MQCVEDDAEVNPIIPASQLEYVRGLPDSSTQYTRFFDALLIPRQSQSAFFRDLRAFRELPITIRNLALCSPDGASVPKEQRQVIYRNVTKQFLGSRFAHPWCRVTLSGNDSLRTGASSGAKLTGKGRRTSKDPQAEEDNFHKLLMPLWVCFRARMFPGEAVVEKWWEEYQLRPPSNTSKNLLDLSTVNPESMLRDDDSMTAQNTASGYTGRYSRPSSDSLNFEDDDDIKAHNQLSTDQQAGSFATGLLRLAAAGMAINSMSRMQKWKLKRELKKQGL